MRYKKNIDPVWSFQFEDDSTTTIVEGLTHGQTYIVSVQAYSIFGSGPWSNNNFIVLELGKFMYAY